VYRWNQWFFLKFLEKASPTAPTPRELVPVLQFVSPDEGARGKCWRVTGW
jgi:hypothetical protein